MPQANILIIGGGAAGLSVAGALKQYNLDAVILDKDAETGQIWRERYTRLHLHTIKGLSHSAYKKLDESIPRYVPKEDFANYLSDYAKHFNLNIQHNVTVTRISKTDSGYKIETESGEIWESPICVIATGINRLPYTPDWEGMDSFKGEISHAMSYKTGKAFAGKRVLVVGIGNTGAEICADLVEQDATYVANSIRTFPSIVKRDMLGIPVHVWGILMLPLPAAVKDFFTQVLVRFELGDLTKYGIKAPEWKIFKDKRIPMIDVGYVAQLKKGKITVKPEIKSFDASGVNFVDGSHEEYDCVIAATGYRTGLDSLLDLPDMVDAEGNVVVESGAETKHKGLWFVGMTDNPAGILMSARMQARKMAKEIAAQLGVVSS